MIRKLNILILSCSAVIPAFAMDAAQTEAKQTISLVNGETLYVFQDGRMAKADKFGRTAHLVKGEMVQSADGQKIIATYGKLVGRFPAKDLPRGFTIDHHYQGGNRIALLAPAATHDDDD